MDDKVCRFHTDRPATSRCTTCFTPLCDECIKIANGQHFCSQKCARNCIEHESMINQFEAKEADDRRRGIRKKRLRRLILLLIILALGYAGWRFREQLMPWLQKARDTIEEKTGNQPGTDTMPQS